MKKKIVSLLLGGLLLFAAPIGNMGTAYAAAAETTTWISDSELTEGTTAEPAKDDVLPTDLQYAYQKEELAAFCHFGPNTFQNVEWGENYGTRPPADLFTLTQDFDAETMVRTLKEAGFERLIVTAKHHDGFCIWASEYTDYDVANTNYKGGQGDILEEISTACTTYDMDMGLYLSPWDIHEPKFGYLDRDGNSLVSGGNNPQPLNGLTWDEVKAKDKEENGDYNEYYKNQLEEVLGNDKYGNAGRFVEVWMDGAKGSGAEYQEYTFQDWFAVIEREEPGCLLFGAEAYTTVRWIGNENGIANSTTWAKSKVNKDANTIDSNRTGTDRSTIGYPDGNQWTVPEADARITSGWFWGPNKRTPKTLEALGNMYFNSVGHNATFLLNVPPNDQGTVDQDILDRVTEFGNAVKQTFDDNFAVGATAKADKVRGNDVRFKAGNVVDQNQDTYWTTDDGQKTGTLLINLDGEKTFDVISIEEEIRFGQRIESFTVEYRSGEGAWKTFAEGTTIGAKRLSRGSRARADQLRITVTALEGTVPMITEVGAFKAIPDFEAGNAMPEGMIFHNDTDENIFSYTGTWTRESGTHFAGETSRWARPTADVTMEFEGSKVYLLGTIDSGHGTANIYIDDVLVGAINTQGSPRKTGQIIFESDTLDDGPHTLRMELTNNPIGFDGAYVINNGGKGMIGLEANSYTMYEDQTMEVVLNRVGGSTGRVTAILEPNPGSAIQDDFDTNPIPVTFEDGETQITVPVKTRRNTNITGDQNFTIELTTPSEELIIGFIDLATITIKDTESFTSEMLQALITEAEPKVNGVYISGYDEFMIALEEAQGVAADASASEVVIGEAYQNLSIAMGALEVRETAYSAEDPFHLPWKKGSSATLEAELGELLNTGAANETWKLSIGTGNWASGGKFVNCLNSGDSVTYYFYARKAGTYTATATFRSGSNTNALNWAGTNVTAGTQAAGHNASGETRTVSFDIVVTAEGNGTLKFTAPAGNSPQLDKLVIVPKEDTITYNQYTVTATAGEGGSISPSGEQTSEEGGRLEFTITPDEGYEISDILVDGVSQGAAATYTIREVLADMTIEAVFSGLVLDKTSLQEALADAKALLANGKRYTPESLSALNAAIAEAEALLDDSSATQEQLNAKAEELNSKSGAMAEIDTDGIDKALSAAKALLEDGKTYDSASLKALNTAIAEAEALLKNKAATQAQLNAGADKLNRQAGAMVEVKEPSNPSDPSTPSTPQNPDNPPKGDDPGTTVTPKPWPFTDIPEVVGAWKYDNAKYVYDRDIMNGISGTTLFDPDGQLTRAMFATVLYRMADQPTIAYSTKFPDVADGKYYTSAILWAADKKIVSGLGDGRYGVDDNITRAQIAKMLYEFGRTQGYDVSGVTELESFTDKDTVREWAVGYLKWAVNAGMISGKPNGDGSFRLDPDGNATRAECAKMLTEFMKKYQP